MRNIKKLGLTMIFTIVVSLNSFTLTAFAGGGETDNSIVSTTEETPKEPIPLTPDGNLTMIDDIDGEQSRDKQFVTMQSKNGNFFYLVIDRADDKENVYFLNLVDEADLLALIEEKPVEPEAEPTPPPVEEKLEEVPEEPIEKSSSSMGIVVVFLIIALAGGGSYYYFKIYKPKQENQNATNLDDFDDDDDEDFSFDNTDEENLYDESNDKGE